MENTQNFIISDEKIWELERTKDERARAQVAAACAEMDRRTQREMEFLKNLQQKVAEQMKAEREAQLEQEVEQAKETAEQEIRQKAIENDFTQSPQHAVYKELLKKLNNSKEG